MPLPGVEDFLITVHEIDYSDINPDLQLRAVLERMTKPQMWIFTASTKEHAMRCVERSVSPACPSRVSWTRARASSRQNTRHPASKLPWRLLE